MLERVVEEQGRPVRKGTAETVEQERPVGGSPLSPAASLPVQDVRPREAQACHAVHLLGAHAAAACPRLSAPVAALTRQTLATNVPAAVLTDSTRLHHVWTALAEEQARSQRLHHERWSAAFPRIAWRWQEDHERAQRLAASFQPLRDLGWQEDQTRLRGMEASFRTIAEAAQARINPPPPAWLAALRTAAAHAKEDNERLQRMVCPTAEETARLQQMLGGSPDDPPRGRRTPCQGPRQASSRTVGTPS